MKILCLGNGDNIGIRVFCWLRKNHLDANLVRVIADEDELRGTPSLYTSEYQEEDNTSIITLESDLLGIRNASLYGNEFIKEVNSNYDVVIITGGWHALLLSRLIRLPKIFIPVGYEVIPKATQGTGFPSLRNLICNFSNTKRDYFYGWLTRNSLIRVNKIFAWFPPSVAVHEALGHHDKICGMAIGEDCDYIRNLINRPLLDQLTKDTDNAKRVLLWFSRVNFTNPKAPEYKGADILIHALTEYLPQLESGELVVYMGKHGEDIEEFNNLVNSTGIGKYIRWREHLDYADLITHLSIPKAVLITDFGEINAGISGIGRDGYAVGIPMINSTTDEIMIKQRGKPGPRIFANSVNELKSAIGRLLEQEEILFQTLKSDTIKYAKEVLDQKVFVRKLMNLCSELVRY